MRFSKFFIPTTKEAPKDSAIKSHEYLVRGGYIDMVCAGVYNFMPLGIKVLDKIKGVVKNRLNEAGALESMLGFVTPMSLWEESGRAGKYGKELLRFKDRKNKNFLLGPTHEEMMVSMVRGKVKSYKQLPLNMYQINTKFRDEARARFGLIRSREFIMKDGYSFHSSMQDLDREFELMEDTYKKIFNDLEIDFRVVEADSGAIGGSGSKEFMALSDIGEDTIVICDKCEYGANIESSSRAKRVIESSFQAQMSLFYTPNISSIDELSKFLKVDPSNILKAVVKKAIYDDKSSEIICFFLRGDDELQEVKAINSINANTLIDANEDDIKNANLEIGFISPIHLIDSKIEDNDENIIGELKTKRFKDIELKCFFDIDLENDDSLFVAGSNIKDYHLAGFPLRKIKNKIFRDLASSREKDICLCGGNYEHKKGIEIGHIFKLGDKYSKPMKANFLDENGKSKPFIMGTYGIGVSRLISAIIEQKSDDKGIIWGKKTSVFDVHIIASDIKDEMILGEATKLYEKLKKENLDVLLDDRKERFGFKMKDFELIGSKYAVIVGKNIKESIVNIIDRKTLTQKSMEIKDVDSSIFDT